MSQKLFSLIKETDQKLHLNKKVIPSKELSILLDAEGVLAKVDADAEQYRLDVLKECEELKIAAQQEGFEAGYEQWTTYVRQLEDEISKVREELSKMLIPVALKAAKKIVGREIELSEDTILDIVSNSLKSVAQHKRVTIYVGKKDFEILEKHRQDIKLLFENLEALSIRERNDVERGGCIIETEGGIINAQLENLWSALERAFIGSAAKSSKPASINKETTSQNP